MIANYLVHISPALAMITPNFNELDIIKENIDLMLAVLPKGTVYRGHIKEAIVSLAIPYTLKFEHPIFEEGDTLETSWYRGCWIVNGSLKQGNVFTGLKCLKKDGTIRFG